MFKHIFSRCCFYFLFGLESGRNRDVLDSSGHQSADSVIYLQSHRRRHHLVGQMATAMDKWFLFFLWG